MSCFVLNKRVNETYKLWFMHQHRDLKQLLVDGNKEAILQHRIGTRLFNMRKIVDEFADHKHCTYCYFGEKSIFQLAGGISNFQDAETLLEGCYKSLEIFYDIPPGLLKYVNVDSDWPAFRKRQELIIAISVIVAFDSLRLCFERGNLCHQLWPGTAHFVEMFIDKQQNGLLPTDEKAAVLLKQPVGNSCTNECAKKNMNELLNKLRVGHSKLIARAHSTASRRVMKPSNLSSAASRTYNSVPVQPEAQTTYLHLSKTETLSIPPNNNSSSVGSNTVCIAPDHSVARFVDIKLNDEDIKLVVNMSEQSNRDRFRERQKASGRRIMFVLETVLNKQSKIFAQITSSYNQHGGEDDNEQSMCPRELSARFHRSICLTDASVVIISVDLGESHVQRCIVNHAVSVQHSLLYPIKRCTLSVAPFRFGVPGFCTDDMSCIMEMNIYPQLQPKSTLTVALSLSCLKKGVYEQTCTADQSKLIKKQLVKLHMDLDIWAHCKSTWKPLWKSNSGLALRDTSCKVEYHASSIVWTYEDVASKDTFVDCVLLRDITKLTSSISIRFDNGKKCELEGLRGMDVSALDHLYDVNEPPVKRNHKSAH